MILKHIEIKDSVGLVIGSKIHDVSLDLSNIDGMIGVVGPNGAGKTTLLYLMQPYLNYPEAPKLEDMFIPGGGRELTFEFDGVTVRSIFKTTKSKSSAFLLVDGTDINPSGNIRSYNEKLEGLLGSPNVFFRTVFCSQRSFRIIDIRRGLRQELFYKLNRLDHYAAKMEHAEGKLKVLEAELGTKSSQVAQQILQAFTAVSSYFQADAFYADVIKGDELGAAKRLTDEHLKPAKDSLDTILVNKATLETRLAKINIESTENSTALSRLNSSFAAAEEHQAKINELLLQKAALETKHGFSVTDKDLTSSFRGWEDTLRELDSANKLAQQAVELAKQRADGYKVTLSEAVTLLSEQDKLCNGLRDAEAELALIDDKLEKVIARQDLMTKQSNLKRDIAALQSAIKATNDLLVNAKSYKTALSSPTAEELKQEEAEKKYALKSMVPCQDIGSDLFEDCPAYKVAKISEEDYQLAVRIGNEAKTSREKRLAKLLEDENSYTANIAANSEKLDQATAELAKYELVPELVAKEDIPLRNRKNELLVYIGEATAKTTTTYDITAIEKLYNAAYANQLEAEKKAADTSKALSNWKDSNSPEKMTDYKLYLDLIDKLGYLKTTAPNAVDISEIATRRTAESDYNTELSKLKAELNTTGDAEAGAKYKVHAFEQALVALNGVDQAAVTKMAELKNEIAQWELIASAIRPGQMPAMELEAIRTDIEVTANRLLSDYNPDSISIKIETLRDATEKGKEVDVLDFRAIRPGVESCLVEKLSDSQKAWVEEAIIEAALIHHSKGLNKTYLTSYTDETGATMTPENAQAFLEFKRAAMEESGRKHRFMVMQNPAIYSQLPYRIVVDPINHLIQVES
jgi:hypothetical protein